jgi:hypothetical protein
VAVAFLPTTLRDDWVSCSNFMNKAYIPLLDIYLEDIAIFDDGNIIISYDSLYYQIKNTPIFIDDIVYNNISQKWLIIDKRYTYEALVPIDESGDWIYIENDYIEIIPKIIN